MNEEFERGVCNVEQSGKRSAGTPCLTVPMLAAILG